jgi:hypothetical protein
VGVLVGALMARRGCRAPRRSVVVVGATALVVATAAASRIRLAAANGPEGERRPLYSRRPQGHRGTDWVPRSFRGSSECAVRDLGDMDVLVQSFRRNCVESWCTRRTGVARHTGANGR